MTWVLLALGFFLMLSGVLGQAYSLKTKRGILPPSTRIWRVLGRLVVFLAGLLLTAMAVGRIVLHPTTHHSALRTVEKSSKVTVVKITS
jgi:hypothetical protein